MFGTWIRIFIFLCGIQDLNPDEHKHVFVFKNDDPENDDSWEEVRAAVWQGDQYKV